MARDLFAEAGIVPEGRDLFAEAGISMAEPANKGSMPANAGMVNFAAHVAGLPVDTAQNVINLGLAGVGSVANLAGKPDLAPNLLKDSFGGSESIKGGLRKLAGATGLQGINPDNPKPGSVAYDLASRGGFIPGGVLPAAASMAAEKVLGPQWGAPAALVPGAVGQGARMAASSMGDRLTPQAKLLQSEGVQLTPGQALGGTVKRMEDSATSIPVLGDAIKASQKRGLESFGSAALNRALEPIGETLPKGLTGNKAVEYTYGKLGDAYEALLPNLKGDLNAVSGAGALPKVAGQPAPPSFKQELDTIKTMGQNLPEAQRSQLNSIIDNEVVGQFTKHGLASGETLKNIESMLNGLAKKKGLSDNYHENQLGGAIKEVQASMRRMINDVNPSYQGELAKINEGYANFKRVQNAAGSVAAPDGVFTAAQLHRAVKSGDTSKDKARFAEGNALMQDLSSAGKSVLPSSVPDSGTPLRAAMMYSMAHPLKAAGLALPIGAATLPYTQMGQGLLSRFMATQPDGQGSLLPLLQSGMQPSLLNPIFNR